MSSVFAHEVLTEEHVENEGTNTEKKTTPRTRRPLAERLADMGRLDFAAALKKHADKKAAVLAEFAEEDAAFETEQKNRAALYNPTPGA